MERVALRVVVFWLVVCFRTSRMWPKIVKEGEGAFSHESSTFFSLVVWLHLRAGCLISSSS